MNFARSILLAFAALAAACERVEVSVTHDSGPNGIENEPTSLTGGPAGQQTLLGRIASSRQVTVFQGVRRVDLYFDEGTVQHHTALRERVSSDGHGQFAIESVEVIQPPMPSGQLDLFLSLQTLRQGMNWRYRDFSIRDVGLFLQNFQAIETGGAGVIAGRPVIELRIERIDASGSVYTLMVDSPTGLVLMAHEESVEGAILSEMRYESLDLAPDLAAVAWHQSVNFEQPLPTTGRLAGQLGFEFRAPRTLPAGFQLVERASVLHPQDLSPWVKATYSDGVESLFFLHGGPIVGDNGIRSGVPQIQADLVEVTIAAPWTIARGNLRSQRVMALGKVGEAEILAMLRSAME